jgi:hypothetical protein
LPCSVYAVAGGFDQPDFQVAALPALLGG